MQKTMPEQARTLESEVRAAMPQIIAWRRQLHRRPELSGMEENTAQMLAAACVSMGLDVRTHIGGHGVLATLKIGDDLPWIALRADMDALPIQDAKEKDYHSLEDGVAHACGHDAHSAMLLGAASVLSRLRRQMQANIAFIFQPAEETCEGAAAMIRDEVLAGIRAQAIYALHVYPYLPSGAIGLRVGAMCAAADMFEVEITGRGGHAARPHECTDVILIASHIIQALHHIISRRINPLQPAVLSIGAIEGGHAANVIPDSVRFSGTFRSLHPETHEQIRSKMGRIIRQTAESWGATARFTLRQATPVLHNDPACLMHARQTFHRMMPTAQLIDIPEPSMGGEDFAAFLAEIPGCLFRLGTGGGPETRYPLHHPCFDIDEQAMHTGVMALASLALNPMPDGGKASQGL